MINEIAPHTCDVLYDATKSIVDTDYVLHFSERTVVIKEDGAGPVIPQWKDLSAHVNRADLIYMFCLNEHNCFLSQSILAELPAHLDYNSIDLFRTLPQEFGWSLILGFHLHNWYLNHRFCGKCGHPTEPDTKERAIVCKACNTTVYPSISPAIIVAIVCKDRILLARGNHFPPGRYSLVAGYVDVGETLEETVVREVKEEVGLDVKNIRYYKNHPWPLSGSLMVGFVAEADDEQTIVIAHNEIADAAWFTRDNLPEHFPSISISGEMIDRFKHGQL